MLLHKIFMLLFVFAAFQIHVDGETDLEPVDPSERAKNVCVNPESCKDHCDCCGPAEKCGCGFINWFCTCQPGTSSICFEKEFCPNRKTPFQAKLCHWDPPSRNANIWLITFFVTCYCAMALAQVEVREAGFSDQYKSENTLGEYAFGFNEDHTTGGSFRRETSDRMGNKIGSYGLRIADGRVRIVNYVADQNGFRADIFSNEPGVESQHSNQFSKITRQRILGVLVPGFRYSSIAPHVAFHGSPPQAKNFLGGMLREGGSNLSNGAGTHSFGGDGMANRYAGKGSPDVFPNDGVHGDDVYSKPRSLVGEDTTNRYADRGNPRVLPNEGFSSDEPHSFNGEDVTNRYAGKINPIGNVPPNERFRGDDAYSKPFRFGGADIINRYAGEGNVGVFPNEGFDADDAYSEHQLNRGNLYTGDENVLKDLFLDDEYSHQSPKSTAPNRTSGLRLEQKASHTSAKVQTKDMHSASTSTYEPMNGMTRIQNETDIEGKNKHAAESATKFGDLNSFPSTIVVSKEAIGRNATYHASVDGNYKNAKAGAGADI